jgi:hypothetical protein
LYLRLPEDVIFKTYVQFVNQFCAFVGIYIKLIVRLMHGMNYIMLVNKGDKSVGSNQLNASLLTN